VACDARNDPAAERREALAPGVSPGMAYSLTATATVGDSESIDQTHAATCRCAAPPSAER
jgi:hypothetical protein